MRRRDYLFGAGLALLIGAGVASMAGGRLGGLSLDLLFWMRHQLFTAADAPADSPTVVVAIDEETYRRPPFAGTPTVFWTKELGQVLDAVVAADAKVVGFDVIYPTSVERYVPGYDRDFLLSLRKAAKAGKVVLGKVQHQNLPIHPFVAQGFAVGQSRNIRSVNLLRDGDEVIRRVPLTFTIAGAGGKGGSETSMALELAARASGQMPRRLDDGGLQLGDYRIPGSENNALLANFAAGNAIPTYSFADLAACVAAGDTDFFRRHFSGKVVLVGTVLDVEDRQVSSKRFITVPEVANGAARCVHPPMAGLFRTDLVRDTIPGVKIQATAVNNLLRHDALRAAGPPAVTAIILGAALIAAALALMLPAQAAGVALAVGGLAWAGLATAVFRHGLVLPLLAPPLAGGLTLALLLGFRFTVSDRDKRLLRHSFALYLAPAVIDRMLAAERPPELGGEAREVTVMFSDLAGFTGLSEGLAPAALVALMNDYLSAMTDIVESHGGFVDKYIGDAIVAVFGAPLDDPGHAGNAVRAALACRDRLAEMNEDGGAFHGAGLNARIGLNTGEVVIGNMGSRRRFNYTVMGDAVNLASRLEGVNKSYGTPILVSEATRRAAGEGIDWREVDSVRVKGREQPLTVFEPLGLAGETPRARLDAAARFEAALATYRRGDLAAARPLFAALAPADPTAAMFVERIEAWRATGAPRPFDGVFTLEVK